jgi:hypothetical protein
VQRFETAYPMRNYPETRGHKNKEHHHALVTPETSPVGRYFATSYNFGFEPKPGDWVRKHKAGAPFTLSGEIREIILHDSFWETQDDQREPTTYKYGAISTWSPESECGSIGGANAS